MERIRLDIIPKGLMPVCHASQYDAGRVIRLDLMDGLQGYSLSDEEIELNVRKPDGHIVTASVDVVEGQTYVDIVTTEQMCAVEGENICELKISKDNAEIYSLNFRMVVEKSVTEGGDPSESFIYNLRTQIAEGVAEEVATQYDSSNVIFDAEPTDNHGIGYTVTSEGIKTAIDNAFDYDNTASGSIVHITDGADNIPVKSLVSQIVAVESGSGEKSPDNPYTISGFDNGVVRVSNHSTVIGSATSLFVDASGVVTSGGVAYNDIIARVKQGETYTYSVNGTASTIPVIAYFTDYPIVGSVSYNNSRVVNENATFTSPINGYAFIRGVIEHDEVNQMVATGTNTEYEQGNTYTFTFGQTVYGGHFDNKGNLVITHGIISDLGSLGWGGSDGQFNYSFNVIPKSWTRSSENWGKCSALKIENWDSVDAGTYSNNSIHGLSWNNTIFILRIYASDYSTADELKSALSGQSLVYELANPITLSITSQDIPTLLGENNIFSNCGDVEVNYYTSKSNDILEFVDSEIGKKNGTNIPIEANSQDSIKDYIDDEISSTKDYIDNGLSGKVDTSYLNNMLVVERKFRDVTFDSYYQSFEIDVTKSGYTPIGTVGFQTNTVGALFFRCNLTGNTLYIGLVARDGTTPIAGTIVTYVDVLYLKNS